MRPHSKDLANLGENQCERYVCIDEGSPPKLPRIRATYNQNYKKK